MEIVLIWMLLWMPLSVACGILADRYNRSGIGWFLVSMLFTPIVGYAFVLSLGPLPITQSAAGHKPTTGDEAPGEPPMSMGDAYRKAQETLQKRSLGHYR